MFGSFRFVLACLVVVEHLYLKFDVFVGRWAVVNFFVLSGYVMTVMVRGHYNGIGKQTLFFYADRALRIYPQYLLFMFLTLFFWTQFDFQFFRLFFTGQASAQNILLNALIVPMNYAPLWPEVVSFFLIPPAWSLGLEEQFYWLFPFLLLKKRWGQIVGLLSLVVYILSLTDVIHAEIFGYRTLPGVLFLFLLGQNWADYQLTKNRENLLISLGLYLFCVGALLWTQFFESQHWEIKVPLLLGVVLGFPILAGLSYLPQKKWDDFVGRASYGIFLSHILVFNLMQHYQIFDQSYTQSLWGGLLLSTLAGFAGSFLTDSWATSLRMKLRRKASHG